MSFITSQFLVICVALCGGLVVLDLVFLSQGRKVRIAAYEGQVTEPDPRVLADLKKEPLLIDYGKSFFAVLACFLVLRSFLVEPFQIPSESMMPTLEVGDFILTNKFAYGIRLPIVNTKIISMGDPQRGDVMVFRYPSDPSVHYIKRVVGLPGDTIRYASDKQLFVNGQLVSKQFIGEEPGTLGSARLYKEKLGKAEHVIREEMTRYNLPVESQWVVPAGHYFMMGDNRDNSNDSRYWNDPDIPHGLLGMVPDKNIVGKAFAIWMNWPDPRLKHLPGFSRAGMIR